MVRAWQILCECGHKPRDHDNNGIGRCVGPDSYGVPCECPGYVEMAEPRDELADYG